MIVREPLVQATYYYLYEAPGDTSDRREDRYRQFVEDTQRMLASVAGWLAMPAPEMPRLAAVNSPPRTLRPLMELAELRGHTNAAAWLQAYALRNMLLLRVVLARPGDHEHTVWRTLDESLGEAPTTPTWLATTRYWCGMAPRLPEDLDARFPQTMRLEFGLFSLGEADVNLLVYPDARGESRARQFLSQDVPRLVSGRRYTLARYHEHVARMGGRRKWRSIGLRRRSTTGLRRTRAAVSSPIRCMPRSSRSKVLSRDVARSDTRATATALNRLTTEYRLALMESGLWNAAPTIWEGRVATFAGQVEQVDAEVITVEATLRRIELMMQTVQTRILLLQSERERLLAYLLAGIGLALIVLLLADRDPVLMLVRIVLLLLVAGGIALAWRRWQRRQAPEQDE